MDRNLFFVDFQDIILNRFLSCIFKTPPYLKIKIFALLNNFAQLDRIVVI